MSYVWICWNSFVKKSLVNFVPPYYILERWIVNEKNYIIHEIFGDDIYVGHKFLPNDEK